MARTIVSIDSATNQYQLQLAFTSKEDFTSYILAFQGQAEALGLEIVLKEKDVKNALVTKA